MKKYILLYWLIISLHTIIYAQDNPLNNNIPPSPNAANLGKIADIPINGYSGTASLNIPLYTVKEKGLEVPISIEYSSSGLKPNEAPSWVGRGWNLNAGGVITRVVKHKPDEGWSYTGGLIGFFYQSDKMLQIHTGDYLLDPDDPDPEKPIIDLEPDIFYFNFLGYSGKFYKNNEAGGFYYDNLEFSDLTMESVPHYNFKYKMVLDLNHRIVQIIITSDDGTKYLFGMGDVTNSDIDLNNGVEYTLQSGKDISTAWYLKSIITPKNEKIQFVYTDVLQKSNFRKQESEYETHLSLDYGLFLGAAGDWRQSELGVIFESMQQMSYLKEIHTSNSIIKFEIEDHPFSMLDQFPHVGWTDPEVNKYLKRLRSINVFDVNNPDVAIKKFQFDYFSDDYPLTLSKIKEINSSGQSLNPYTFDYYHLDLLPKYYTCKIDHWGYYNGDNNDKPYSLLPDKNLANDSYPQRDPNATCANYGMLKTVLYPTGGTVTFEYQSNSYTKLGVPNEGVLTLQNVTEAIAGGVRVSKVIYNDGTSDAYEKDYAYGNGILYSKPEYYLYLNILAEAGGAVVGTYWERSRDSYVPLGSPHISYESLTESQPGKGKHVINYTTLNDYPDLIVYSEPIEQINEGLAVKIDKLSNSFINVAITQYDKNRGKIKSEIYYNEAGDILKEINYTYESINSNSILAYKIVQPFLNKSFTMQTDDDEWLTFIIRNFYLPYYIPTSFDYLKTKEVIDHFSTGNVVNTEISTYKTLLSNTYVLDNKKTNNSSGKDVVQKYVYPESSFPSPYVDMYNNYMVSTPLETYEILDGNVVSGNLTTYKLAPSGSFMPASVYKMKSMSEPIGSFSPFDGTVNSNYYKNEPEVTFSQYDNYNNIIIGKNIEGRKQSILWGYKYNYPRAIIDNLDNQSTILPKEYRNIENAVIGTSNYEDKPTDGDYILKTFDVLSEKDKISLKITDIYNFDYYNCHYPTLCFFNLDTKTNYLSIGINPANKNQIKEYSLAKGTYQIKIQVPVGSLPNFISSVFYVTYQFQYNKCIDDRIVSKCYFEDFEDYSDATNLRSLNRTGKYSYLGAFNVPKDLLLPGSNYILSYWNSTDGLNWIYNEQALTIGTSNIVIGSSGNYLDDVRIYPVGAQMTTYTYDPFIGMTSQTDPNGITTYYSYDKFNRLQLIKDRNGNVIKTYDYNYKVKFLF